MTLTQLKSLLREHSGRHFRIQLPDGEAVPVPSTSPKSAASIRFSSTAAASSGNRSPASSKFGSARLRSPDRDRQNGRHPRQGRLYLPDESVPVEIEYEDQVISQYTIPSHEISPEAVVLQLAHKHTECLAPELCGLPALAPPAPEIRLKIQAPCCGPTGCC